MSSLELIFIINACTRLVTALADLCVNIRRLT